MDAKLILPGILLIGGAVFFLRPDPPRPTHEAVVEAPKSREQRTAEAIVRGSIAGAHKAGRKEPVYDGTNPEVLRRKELAGFVYRSPAMVRAGDGFALVTQVLSGIDPDSPRGLPAALHPVAVPADCAWRRPGPGDQVATVHTHTGGPYTNAHAYDDALVAQAALRGLREHKARRGTAVTDNGFIVELPPGTALRQVDVVVNLPGAPVFLTLQDARGGVLWNLQPMPGTTLSQVTLLSGGHSGVANVPEGVAVQGQTLTGRASCAGGLKPVEPPPPEAAPRDGYRVKSDRTLNHALRGFDRYAIWFEGAFGHPPGTGVVVQAGGMAHALLGDLPTEAQPYRPLQGATLHVIPAPLTYAAATAEHEAWMRDRAVRMLAAAYGTGPEADLGALMRAPLAERRP